MGAKYLQGVQCQVDGCLENAAYGGKDGILCDRHYQRVRKRGTTDAYKPKGVSRMPEYRHWINMRSRCNTPSSTGFENYGGRGIRVCKEWDQSFERFLEDMGRRPSPSHSVDRIDTNGNYEPGNCRWATHKTQCRNLRSNRMVPMGGKLVTLAEAAESTGIKSNTLLYRLRRGWSPKDALTRAVQERSSK